MGLFTDYVSYPARKILVPLTMYNFPKYSEVPKITGKSIWSALSHKQRTSAGKMSYVERNSYVMDRFKEKNREGYDKLEELARERKPKVIVIATGGTALCKKNEKGFNEPLLNVDDLVNRIYGTGELYDIRKIEPPKIDSGLMNPQLQLQLARTVQESINENRPDGVVIIHGTYTMANAANALNFLLEDLPFPVVLTGSMIPGESKDSDAFENFKYALYYATVPPITPGVYVSFNDKLHEGTRVIHNNKNPVDAFESVIAGKRVESGRFFDETEMRDVKLPQVKGIATYELTNLGICPNILDDRIPFPIKTNSWEEAYTFLKTVSDQERLAKRNDVVRIRLDAERPTVKGISVYPESRDFDSLLEANGEVIPVGNRFAIYLAGYSGDVQEPASVLKAMTRGIPVVLGSKLAVDIVESSGVQYYMHEGFDSTVIHAQDMTEEAVVTKTSIIMGELNRRIIYHERADLAEPPKYLEIIRKLLQLTNFAGEIIGPKSPVKLFDAISEYILPVPQQVQKFMDVN